MGSDSAKFNEEGNNANRAPDLLLPKPSFGSIVRKQTLPRVLTWLRFPTRCGWSSIASGLRSGRSPSDAIPKPSQMSFDVERGSVEAENGCPPFWSIPP